MSFDVFLQGFVAGESAAGGGAEMRAVLAPFAIANSGDSGQIRYGDGEADIYLDDDGMVANHVSGLDPWDLLVRGAQAANWVIMPVGCPDCLTQPGQRGELPEELSEDIEFVASGAELRAVFESR